MRYMRLIILILGLLATTCLFLWLRSDGGLAEFGLNALTETIGILVTVLIVDGLIRRQEEARALPQKAAAYEDVRLLVSRIVSFWTDACRASVPGDPPETLERLFSAEAFDRMGKSLNLDANPNVTPPRTWWEWLPENLLDHRKRAETILERHNHVLDPPAYRLVHQLATEGVDPTMITALRLADKRLGFPRVRVMGSYCILPDSYYGTVLALIAWCRDQAKLLERNGLKGLRQVPSGIDSWKSQNAPPSMISQTEFMNQCSAVEEFRRRNRLPKGVLPKDVSR